jgi:hypothetical protein
MWGPWQTGAYPIFYRWGVVLHIKMDMDQICVHRPTQTNKYRPIQIYKWFGPLKISLARADSCRTSQGGRGSLPLNYVLVFTTLTRYCI